jgi:hypothetical protein
MTTLRDNMELLATAGCSGSNCPTVYRQDEDTLVIQGFEAEQLFTTKLPDGETAVSVPLALIRDLKL